jgi:hypothetical protein
VSHSTPSRTNVGRHAAASAAAGANQSFIHSALIVVIANRATPASPGIVGPASSRSGRVAGTSPR